MLWYRIPVEPFGKAIVLGFTPYLVVFTIAMNALSVFGWHQSINVLSGYAHSIAYLALVGYWNVAVRRTAADLGESAAISSPVLDFLDALDQAHPARLPRQGA